MQNDVMNQVIVQCTSSTRPTANVQGMTVYETDTNLYSVYDGSAWVNTSEQSAFVAANQTTGSTSYVDLATVGPSVSVQTNTKALVEIGGVLYSSALNDGALMTFAVSGATTVSSATNDGNGVRLQMVSAGANVPQVSCYGKFLLTGLTAGVNTFKCQYAAFSGGTAGFVSRSITVKGVP